MSDHAENAFHYNAISLYVLSGLLGS